VGIFLDAASEVFSTPAYKENNNNGDTIKTTTRTIDMQNK
jgi:hypothetical protein